MMTRTGIIAMIEKPSVMIYYAKCKKCGKIIGDSSDPVEVTTLKPEDIKSTRIKCRNCKTLNFVSHV